MAKPATRIGFAKTSSRRESPLSEELDGSAYLAALKRSAKPQGAATPAPAFGAEPVASHPAATENEAVTVRFARLEKRRSVRHKCNGSAEIRHELSGVRTWATCTDISLTGCYLEAAATYPADTLLQLRIDIKNFRIQMQGTVRVTYAQVGMGIAFTYVTEEERSHLKEMLRTLARPSLIMGSPLAAPSASDPMPRISDPAAALSALTKYFEDRQMLTRSEFILLLRRSQDDPGNGARH
jgi:hypothetical protein